MEDDRTIIAVEWNGTVNVKRLARVVDAFRVVEAVDEAAVIDVLLTGDVAVAELNERYRGVKGPTDVLAFETAPPGVEKLDVWALGQIVISCDSAAEQARVTGIELGDELATLLVHGLLHLAGYNHDDGEATSAMNERSELILSKVLDV
ncbi:MAG: rRNA maturation RNase YbeY [Candidatus Coatesbacteria bacterium]|nr:MAG: rRNA maturation RNase YbeY [Candidatus Coatesbacteria bacterium]